VGSPTAHPPFAIGLTGARRREQNTRSADWLQAMSALADLVRRMAAAGASAEAIALAVEAVESATETTASDGPKRSKAALRTERWRARKASQTVTDRHSVTSQEASQEPSQSVTNRHTVTPLARVKDNPSTSLVTGYVVVDDVEGRASERVDDWPEGSAARHAAILFETCQSPRLDPDKSAGLITSRGRLVAWRRDGASWQHDVLPVIGEIVRKRGPPVSTWTYFDKPIAQSIANNRRALEIPEHDQSQPR